MRNITATIPPVSRGSQAGENVIPHDNGLFATWSNSCTWLAALSFPVQQRCK